MSVELRDRDQLSRAGLSLVVALVASMAWADDPPKSLPWEIWNDLGEIARLRYHHQIVMRSSRCPDGCAFDRHSEGDERYIRTIGDEGVIFEVEGAGAITRIWMTQGDAGISHALDGNIHLRLTLDGASAPVFDLPLPEVFGVTAPFTPPLAVDRLVASGGNVNVVPIPFRNGCRLSLVGADAARIWFQVTGHRLASADGVTTFAGSEDLSTWRSLLSSPGADPWVDGSSQPTISGSVVLDPGETEVVGDLVGPDSLTALLLEVPRERWNVLELVLDFDGDRRVEMAVADFFGIGRAGADATRSLLIGSNGQDELYSYFPMPFFRSARIALRLAGTAAAAVRVDFIVRRRDELPTRDSGIFGAKLRVVEPSVAGRDSVIADVEGPGRWVGLFLEAASVGTQSQAFLEGDERVRVDGSRHPVWYGTGVEDFFGGGFYFRIDNLVSTPFRRALHGLTYDLADAGGRVMGMYRLMLTDAPVFGSNLEVGLEAGPLNQTAVRFRAVSYYYSRTTPPMRRRDLLDVGDAQSRLAHLYGWTGNQLCSALDGLFEDEPPTRLAADVCSLNDGSSSFVLRGAQFGHRLMLRRRFDNGEGDQRATVTVTGLTPFGLGFEDANPYRRWREREFLTDTWWSSSDEAPITLQAPLSSFGFSEAVWELWAGYPPGTCDLVVDGVCDAVDVAEAVRRINGGPVTDEMTIAVLATYD